MSEFYQKNRIIVSDINEKNSLAILSDSEHFDNTLIVTLFSGSKDTTIQILLFLQNYGQENNCERIQILTKEQLPVFNSLEHRISFHLMKKSLA